MYKTIAKSLHETLPYFQYYKNFILTKTFDISLGYEINLYNKDNIEEKQLYKMIDNFNLAIALLDEDTIIHIKTINVKKNINKKYLKSIIEKKQSVEKKYLLNNYINRKYVNSKSYIYITFVNTKTRDDINKNNTFSKRKFIDNKFKNRVLDIENQLNNFENFISKVFKKVKRINVNEYLSKLNENIFQEQIPTDILINKEGDFKIGEKEYNILSLSNINSLPNELKPSRRDEVSTDKNTIYNSIIYNIYNNITLSNQINTIIYIINENNIKKEFKKTHQYIKIFGKISNNVNSIEANNKVTNNIDLANQEFINSLNKENKAIYFHHNVIIDKNTDNKNLIFNKYTDNGITPVENVIDKINIYWSCLPFSAHLLDFSNSSFLSTTEIASMFIKYENDNIYNNENGVLVTNSINNIPYNLNLFDNNKLIKNKNMFIVGGSGSGKSNFLAHLLKSYYEMNSHIFIVDKGNSYLFLTYYINEISNGKNGIIYKHSDDNPISFNPFFVENKIYTESKLASLKGIINTIYSKKELSQLEGTIITNSLEEYSKYCKLNPNVIQDFNSYYNYFKNEFNVKIDFNKEEFLYIIEPYTKISTSKGKLLNKTMDNDLIKNKFIVFETDQLESNETLYNISLLTIIEIFKDKVYKLPNEKKVLCNDETWKFLSSPLMSEYLQDLARTIRKNKGYLWLSSQNPEDFAGDEKAQKSIFNNCDTKIIMDLSKFENTTNVLQKLSINNHSASLIFSLNRRINKIDNREACIMQGNENINTKKIGVELSLFERMLFTTTPSEKTKINKYYTEEKSIINSIEKYIRDDYKKQ